MGGVLAGKFLSTGTIDDAMDHCSRGLIQLQFKVPDVVNELRDLSVLLGVAAQCEGVGLGEGMSVTELSV